MDFRSRHVKDNSILDIAPDNYEIIIKYQDLGALYSKVYEWEEKSLKPSQDQ